RVKDYRQLHVFLVRVNNVKEQRVRQIFQLYGYMFACDYTKLEPILRKQLTLALNVDSSKFEIKVSNTVRPELEICKARVFKTINVENFVWIEPINNEKVCQFNRYIEEWCSATEHHVKNTLKNSVCNLLNETEIHLMLGVINSDV